VDTNNDRLLIYGAALLRGLAAGAISVLAAVYLAKRGFDEAALGVVLSAGMAGVLAGTIFGTYFADKIGRRSSLVILALLAAVGGALLVATDTLWAAALVAFFGMLNTQGSDRGAAQALEQAILPATTTDADRTQVFARYNAIADVGGAAGALLAALPALLRDRLQVPELPAYDATVLVYAALILIVAVLYAVCPRTRKVRPCLLWRILRTMRRPTSDARCGSLLGCRRSMQSAVDSSDRR
jgi:MFS family permease